MTSRTQRYRLTHEFVLKDRSNYCYTRGLYMRAIAQVIRWLGGHNIQQDYLAIEKVQDDD